MTGLLVRKLQTYLPLPETDKTALEALRSERVAVAGKTEIAPPPFQRQAIHQIETGYACRYRLLPDGRRQISGFMIPGDFIDLRKFVLTGTQHAILSFTDLTLLGYPASPFLHLLETHPRTAQAVWRSLLSEESIAQEWLVSLGQRSALERVAHLLCELQVRHAVMNGVLERTFLLPVTQSELGDAMGLSTVHVNRTIKALRERDLIATQQGRVEVLDFRRLAELALFSPDYLYFRILVPQGGNS